MYPATAYNPETSVVVSVIVMDVEKCIWQYFIKEYFYMLIKIKKELQLHY